MKESITESEKRFRRVQQQPAPPPFASKREGVREERAGGGECSGRGGNNNRVDGNPAFNLILAQPILRCVPGQDLQYLVGPPKAVVSSLYWPGRQLKHCHATC